MQAFVILKSNITKLSFAQVLYIILHLKNNAVETLFTVLLISVKLCDCILKM